MDKCEHQLLSGPCAVCRREKAEKNRAEIRELFKEVAMDNEEIANGEAPKVCKEAKCAFNGVAQAATNFRIHAPSGGRIGVCSDCMTKKCRAHGKRKKSGMNRSRRSRIRRYRKSRPRPHIALRSTLRPTRSCWTNCGPRQASS